MLVTLFRFTSFFRRLSADLAKSAASDLRLALRSARSLSPASLRDCWINELVPVGSSSSSSSSDPSSESDSSASAASGFRAYNIKVSSASSIIYRSTHRLLPRKVPKVHPTRRCACSLLLIIRHSSLPHRYVKSRVARRNNAQRRLRHWSARRLYAEIPLRIAFCYALALCYCLFPLLFWVLRGFSGC